MKEKFRNEEMGLKGAAMTLFLCALWGGLTPTIKLSLEGMPPFGIAAWRFLLGALVLWIWCLVRGREWRVPSGSRLAIFLFACVFVAQIGAINWGTRLTAAKYAIVLVTTSPIFVALLSHQLIPGDRLSVRKVLGLSAAFLGIVLIFGLDASAGRVFLGNALALVSGFLLAVLQVYAKHLVTRLTAYQVVLWEMTLGVPLFFAVSLLSEPTQYELTVSVVVSLLYQGIVIAGFCFVSWIVLLERYAASRLSAYQFSIPIFGVLLSRLLLGEEITPMLTLGVAMVAVGIYVVSRERQPAV